MKNIVVLVPSVTIGGREKVAINTVKCLQEDYNVFLVVFDRKDIEYKVPCDIYCLNTPASNNKIKKIINVISRGQKLLSFCRKNKIDCIYSFGEAANLVGAFVKRFLKIKLICSIHGFKEVYKSSLPNFFISKADKIICISKDMEREFLNLYPNAPTCVVENGYEIGLYKNETPFDPNAPKIVSMGRLVPIKAFDRLINAFISLKKIKPKASLTIIGDGPESEKLRNLAKGADVNFVGYKQDPSEELLKNNIYILCSKNEGFPNSLIEALSCGLCIISVDCHSGPKEILSENYFPENIKGIVFEKYGVLVPNSELAEDLIKKAVLELTEDKEKFNNYKETGPKRALDFSIEVYRDKIKALLEKLNS